MAFDSKLFAVCLSQRYKDRQNQNLSFKVVHITHCRRRNGTIGTYPLTFLILSLPAPPQNHRRKWMAQCSKFCQKRNLLGRGGGLVSWVLYACPKSESHSFSPCVCASLKHIFHLVFIWINRKSIGKNVYLKKWGKNGKKRLYD